jgi:pimeloyl-ACP methyl ester carboxylesterase
MVVVALGCAWLTLCLLYWQGSWQLLYHPRAAITQTPASAGLGFEPVRFGASETGQPRLTGWWIPGDPVNPPFTVLYLHGANGNLSDTVTALAALHKLHLGVFAIDYRGFGQSEPARPSEKLLRQDAEQALDWLTSTRHVAPGSVVLYGEGLGANLAAELAAAHREVAGAILECVTEGALEDPMRPVFADSRSRLVPARALVADRYDLQASAQELRIPSLWILPQPAANQPAIAPAASKLVQAPSTQVWLISPFLDDPHYGAELERWLDDLPAKREMP